MSYWLAVITEENCRALAKQRYPFYALQHKIAVVAGERCILYRSGKSGGFVGEFEFASAPEKVPVQIGSRTFSFKMPWTALVLRDDTPVKIGPIVQALNFIKNKRLYGMALRTTFRRLEDADYERISNLLMQGGSEFSARQHTRKSKG
jgi:hypothetical protein